MGLIRTGVSPWGILAGAIALVGVVPLVQAGRPHTVRLAFDGGEIVDGKGNASIPSSACFAKSGSRPAFAGSAEQRAAIIDHVVEELAPFDIHVVTQALPPELPHDLVLVGGSAEDYGYSDIQGHTCDVDCGDDWHRNVVAVFPEEVDDDPTWVATSILHELGHAWGLDHVDGRDHIMYRGLTDEVQTWAMGCTDLGPLSKCGGSTLVDCMSDRQDSYGELLARFGPPTQDMAAPTITFSSPVDGEVVDVGFVDVVVEIDDDRDGYGWALRSPLLEKPMVAYEPGQLSLTIDVAKTGTFPLEATVIDQAGKRGTAVIEIRVGDVGEGDSSGDGNDSDASQDEWTDYGCGCQTGGDDRGAPWMLVAVVGLLRRRRARERQR